MEEINFIRPQEVYDRNTGESKVRYTSYDGSNNFIPVVDCENGVPRTLVVTTHAELKAMRDAGKLTPGSLYRITDYQCTTTQENTRSAGHQFDIVLLALSEDKLAEEGWAIMHDNIYDVTFADGTRRRCYIYFFKDDNGEQYNIVYADTLIGCTGYIEDGDIVNIDEENKTASVNLIQDFEIENLTYNYFQNSNLSAWKVWYCLDNDTARFAWADDSVDESSKKETIKVYISAEDIAPTGEYNLSAGKYQEGMPESIEIEGKTYYVWGANGEGAVGLTLSRIPKEGDKLYFLSGDENEIGYVISYQPENLIYNGRGVIYRLIDEWNIDYPCDFKNMQMLIPMDSNGDIDMQNPVTSKYCYAFTDNTSGEPEDLSIKGHAINIKVKPCLTRNANSVMYLGPGTLFYTNNNEEQIDIFSNVTVGEAYTTTFINRGHNINILDYSNSVMLKNCSNICIGYDSSNIMFNNVDRSTFGSKCQNIQLTGESDLNYGNGGVELATKDDLN